MIRHYTFDYNIHEAEACFQVDTSIFTNEHAQVTLDFFSWDYDKDEDPIDAVLKKYAIKVIELATFNNTGVKGVIKLFKNIEGFANIDGSNGIELNLVSLFEFEEYNMDMTVIFDKPKTDC